MWRRSWVSREVLLYTLFFGALAAITSLSAAGAVRDARPEAVIARLPAIHQLLSHGFLTGLGWTAAITAIGGTICSACIYLVPARPSWNMIHTPLDFLLTTALLGSLIAAPLHAMANRLAETAGLQWALGSRTTTASAAQPVVAFAALWILNQLVRWFRMRFSRLYERRASAMLLRTESLKAVSLASFATVGLAACFAIARLDILASLAGLAGVLMARYLFFVSVVPLNMALTFVRGGRN
jgi:DMSO reductase anchor subunit